MGKLDRSGIGTAMRLLAKAESTDSDHEAIALAVRSYSLLADTINAYDLANSASSGTRRRERRRLWDRRSATRPPSEQSEPTPTERSMAVDGYLRLSGGGERTDRGIDLPM